MNYKKWLIKKGFGRNTAENYDLFINKNFKLFLHENQINIENLEHENLMQYIRYRKNLGFKPKTINQELKKIAHYLDYMGLKNIAEPIRVKGVQRRIPHDLLSEKQLDDIYHNFHNSRNTWTHENTFKTYHCILGLRIYQGLQQQELTKLETSHLQLEKGKIYVPATKRANKRILELKPCQILSLNQYLVTERMALNREIPGKNLFHPQRLKWGMPRIKNMINRYEPSLQNLAQIRASVITNWLKHYNLRQVQYMAGHKYVSSTENYRQDLLEDLQKELDKHHPLAK